MSPKKREYSRDVQSKHPLLCKDCAYCTEPHSLSLTGIPTLARCKYEKWSVLYQRPCKNGNFKVR